MPIGKKGDNDEFRRKSGQGGSIISIASLAAVYGMPYALHYATSKAAGGIRN